MYTNPNERHIVSNSVESAKGLAQNSLFVDLVNNFDGAVEAGRFVSRTAVEPIAATRLNESGQRLLEKFGVSRWMHEPEAIAALSARHTYLSKSPTDTDPAEYVAKIIAAGERSIGRSSSVLHLISGISIPSVIELIRRGGEISRLTTSKTKTMTNPCYRLFGAPATHSYQREAVARFLELKHRFEPDWNDCPDSAHAIELWNICNLQSKTITLLHSMNQTQLHTLVKKVLSEGAGNPEFEDIILRLGASARSAAPALFPEVACYRNASPHESAVLPAIQDLAAPPVCIEKPHVSLEFPSLQIEKLVPREHLGSLMFTFTIRGVGLETVLELAAHEDVRYEILLGPPSYRIQGTPVLCEFQRRFITAFCHLRREVQELYRPFIDSPEGMHAFTCFDLGNRCYSVRFSRNLPGLHSLFIGRLAPSGNELEIQEVCEEMRAIIHKRFPNEIQTREFYANVGVEAKF